MPTWYANVTAVDGSVTYYNLSDKNPFKLLSITGIGNAAIRRLEERGPFQEGVTDTGYRVDPRYMTLTIEVYGTTASAADANRDLASKIFSPGADAILRLLVVRDDGSQRQIDCYVTGEMDMSAQLPNRTLNNQRIVVRLKAPNPVWYDPQIKTLSFSATGTPTNWWLAGGLIGTANVVTYSDNPASGSAQAANFPSPGYNTFFIRSQRPSSGTQVAFDYRYGTGSGRHAFIATGSVDWTTGYAPNSGSNYDTVGGSAVFYRGGRIFQSDGGTIVPLNFVSPIYASMNGTVVWGRNYTAGSAWTNPISHAAAYNILLSDAQMLALAQIAGSASATSFVGTVNIAGNWSEFPVINIVGPIQNPIITNLATGEKLALSGTLSGSTMWVIDTRYGYKTITQGGSSIIEKLSDDSDLASFHLQPGANPLQITTTGGTTSATEIQMNYYDRFLSA